MRLMIRLALERSGYRVIMATNGLEAVDIYRRHGADIAAVVLDVQMPDMGGPHTLDALLELDPHVRACFVSGDTGKYAPRDLIQRGALAVLFKPFRLNELADVVRRMSNGEHPIDPDARQLELPATAMFVDEPKPVVIDAGSNTIPI
jgi:CheY-like chemotaxis protein